MPRIHVSLAALLLCVLSAVVACGGGASTALDAGAAAGGGYSAAQQPLAAVPGGMPELAQPWALLGGQPSAGGAAHAVKQVSYTENDLGMDGSDYDPALPKQNFSKSGKEVTLMPNYTGHPTDTGGLGYVTYHFQIPGYDRNPQVRLGWSTPPADAKTVWLGLSYWDHDRWDWYQGTLSGVVDLPYIDRYFNFSGDLLLVVLRIGTDWSGHDEVRIGGPTPVAALSADVTQGDIPLTVHLDASASNPVEGLIVKYEWDTDGDGDYDAETGNVPSYTTSYSNNGEYHPTVRVTNVFNATDTQDVTVFAVGPWQHTWGMGKDDQFSDCVADSDGNIYAAGTFNKPSGPLNFDVVLTKWTPTGQLLWANSYDSGEDDICNNIELDSEGNLVLSGSQDSLGERQLLLQKWTPNGSLSWSKRTGGASFDQALALVVDDTDIYLAGNTSSVSATTDVFVTKADTTGTAQWTRSRDFGDYEYATSLNARANFIAGFTGVVMGLEAKLGAEYNIIKLEYETDGTFDGGAQLGTSAQPKRYGQVMYSFNPFTLQSMYYIGGTIDMGFGPWPFLAKTDGAGNALFGNALETADAPQIWDMSFDSTGINLCGFITDVGFINKAILTKFNSGTGEVMGCTTWGTADDAARSYGVQGFHSGVLVNGFGLNSTGSWSTYSADHSTLSLDFTTLDGAGTEPAWNWQLADGTVTNIDPSGVLDTGGGVNDAWLAYRPEL